MTLNQQTVEAFILGACIGSFLNVIHLRFGHWKSIAVTRSACPHCHHALAWYDLVPMLSFIVLRGRCRYCGKRIVEQYIIIEVLCGLATALVWRFMAPASVTELIRVTGLLVFVYSTIVMILQDAHEMEVADLLFGLSFIGALIYASDKSLVSIVIGAVSSSIILLGLVVVSKERWMGWGDVLLAVPIGIILGYPKSLLWVYLAFVIGAAYGVFLMVTRRKERTDPVPFIPIMALAFMIAFLYGDQMIHWYTSLFL